MSDGFIPTKDKTAAAIITMEGDELTGFLFLTSNERLIDVVNDERQFLPFERDDGEFVIINKSTISRIQIPDGNPNLRLPATD